MTYYQTDPETGELLGGPHEAREDPRTPGHFFLPRGGVTEEPPYVEPGEVAVWTGEEWQAVEDHRGKAGWVGDTFQGIEALGPLPEGWSDEPPPPPPMDPADIVVSPRQIRLALLDLGISPEMVAAQLSDNPAALIEWEYATYIERGHPLVAALAATLELSEAQIDDLFSAAQSL